VFSVSRDSRFERSEEKSEDVEGTLAPGIRASGEMEMLASRPRWDGVERRDWKAVRSSWDAKWGPLVRGRCDDGAQYIPARPDCMFGIVYPMVGDIAGLLYGWLSENLYYRLTPYSGVSNVIVCLFGARTIHLADT